jgi:CNT family concentrative nucleoside transporter
LVFFCILLLAYGLSRQRQAIDWSVIVSGLALQLLLALFVLKVPQGQALFMGARAKPLRACSPSPMKVRALCLAPWLASPATMDQLFGPGGPLYFCGQNCLAPLFLVATLVAMGYYLGVLQLLVRGFAWLVNKVLRVSGAEALSNSASVFCWPGGSPAAD